MPLIPPGYEGPGQLNRTLLLLGPARRYVIHGSPLASPWASSDPRGGYPRLASQNGLQAGSEAALYELPIEFAAGAEEVARERSMRTGESATTAGAATVAR